MNASEWAILSKMFGVVFESDIVLWFSNNLHVALQTSVLGDFILRTKFVTLALLW